MTINKTVGKAIITHLINGDPKGIKSVFMYNRTCECVVIPRSLLEEAKKLTMLDRPSLYVLLGWDDDPTVESRRAYIGETENFLERISVHNREKPFWQEVIVFGAKDGTLTKASIRYLEYLSIHEVKGNDIYNLEENKAEPTEPSLPEYQRDVALDFYSYVKILTAFLGYRLFESNESPERAKTANIESAEMAEGAVQLAKVAKPTGVIDLNETAESIKAIDPDGITELAGMIHSEKTSARILYCKSNQGVFAACVYDNNSFRILTGSQLRKEAVASFLGKERRKILLQENAREKDDYYLLIKSIVFETPSAASDFCLGFSSNGWNQWKDARTNRTLYQIVRGEHIIDPDIILSCKSGKGTDARGIYENKDSFLVLAGSKLRKGETGSFLGKERRDALLLKNAKEKDDHYLLVRSVVFETPSAAASFCLGFGGNGWNVWIDEETDKTLDEIVRSKQAKSEDSNESAELVEQAE